MGFFSSPSSALQVAEVLSIELPDQHHDFVHPVAINAKPFSPHRLDKHFEIELANCRWRLRHDLTETFSKGSLHIGKIGISHGNIFMIGVVSENENLILMRATCLNWNFIAVPEAIKQGFPKPQKILLSHIFMLAQPLRQSLQPLLSSVSVC